MTVTNPVDTVSGALRELLDSARENIERTGGTRGFPAALALFSVIDTIGSYHRGDTSFTVLVDGQQHSIGARRARDHTRILNSHYFGLTLSMAELKDLYSLARSPVTHNATLGPGLWLSAEAGDHQPIMQVTVAAFLRVAAIAVCCWACKLPVGPPRHRAAPEVQRSLVPTLFFLLLLPGTWVPC